MAYIHTVEIDGGVPHLIEPKLYATATLGQNNTWIAGVTDFELYAGAYVHVKVGEVTTGAKLNVNGTGAKNIYYNGDAIASGVLTSGNIYTFVYTGTNWELLGDITNKNILIGTNVEWASQNSLRPPVGTILIFTEHGAYLDENDNRIVVPGIKISDGRTPPIDLPFIGQDVEHEIMNHINNSNIHVTSEEKAFWNNKLNCEDIIVNNNLILNRN